MKERYVRVTHCPSTGAYLLRITRLGRTALYCYSVITVVLGCIPTPPPPPPKKIKSSALQCCLGKASSIDTVFFVQQVRGSGSDVRQPDVRQVLLVHPHLRGLLHLRGCQRNTPDLIQAFLLRSKV